MVVVGDLGSVEYQTGPFLSANRPGRGLRASMLARRIAPRTALAPTRRALGRAEADPIRAAIRVGHAGGGAPGLDTVRPPIAAFLDDPELPLCRLTA